MHYTVIASPLGAIRFFRFLYIACRKGAFTMKKIVFVVNNGIQEKKGGINEAREWVNKEK